MSKVRCYAEEVSRLHGLSQRIDNRMSQLLGDKYERHEPQKGVCKFCGVPTSILTTRCDPCRSFVGKLIWLNRKRKPAK